MSLWIILDIHRSSCSELLFKSILWNFAKFTEKDSVPETLIMLKEGSLAQVLSCEFCKISKNTFFYKTRLVASSVCISYVTAQHCLISFEIASHCREFENYVFNKWLTDDCNCFICGNSWVWFCVLNKNESLRVLMPHFYLRLFCVGYVKLVKFSKYFAMLHACFEKL